MGPFDFGRIAVPIDVNIDSDDYFLWAETGDMPQRFEGIPVRISEMQVDLFGMADQGTPSTADDKPFMSNPRTCTTALDLTAEVVAPDSSTTDLTSQIGPFTGCENLNLDDNSIEISNYNDAAYNDKPERPTKLGVKVTQGTGTDQAALKDLSVDLPGFRLARRTVDTLLDTAPTARPRRASERSGWTRRCCRRTPTRIRTTRVATSTRCGVPSTSRRREPRLTVLTATSWRFS